MPSSNIAWEIAIAAGFVLGLALFVVSSAMLRASSRRAAPAQPSERRITWPNLIDEDLKNATLEMRLDMIDRLSLVPGAWSRDILEAAQAEENDPHVLSAIAHALQRV